ncbi:MAG TPA: hypothetical protein VI306_03875 [Pyrinomonadaceae bacterium]
MRRGFLWQTIPIRSELRVHLRTGYLAILILLITTVGPIVSHSGNTQEPAPNTGPADSKQESSEIEQLRKTIRKLKADNEQLRSKLAESEHKLQTISLRDHLTKEELRQENLMAQLVVIGEKEAALQKELDDVNEQLRPENIQHLFVAGSLHPEAVRESTQRRLTNSQGRIQAQINVLHNSRSRLQSSLALTDAIIQNLRLQLQTTNR